MATYYDYLRWVEQQNHQQPVQSVTMQPILSYVANKTAADLFNVNPGQSAILIDIDSPQIYKKSRGADGKLLPLEIFDLTPHKEPVAASTAVNLDGYVRYEDLNRIVSDEVEKRITEVFAKPKKKTEEKKEEEA